MSRSSVCYAAEIGKMARRVQSQQHVARYTKQLTVDFSRGKQQSTPQVEAVKQDAAAIDCT